jgi:hypothetical protein
MSLQNQSEVEKHMQSLDDHALLRVIAIESADYRPEALDIARSELRRRSIAPLATGEYLTRFPEERVGSDGFCAVCRSKTTDQSPGNTSTVNFVLGNRLIGSEDRCPACGSVEQTLWLQIVLPIIPLGRYRVIYLDKDMFSSRYVGRKLRQS